MNHQLTEPEFWKNFWEAKQNLVFKIKPDYTFHKIINQINNKQNIKSAIELGGFPGYYSVYLRKYFNIDVTLFDYYIHPKIIEDLMLFNDLEWGDISIIEADLFSYQPKKTYDLVCSFGLIEHFKNTEDIIAKHLNYLNLGGTLLITLPNFKGVNGWVQKTFDQYNYKKHFVDCMNLDNLTKTAKKLGLQNVKTFYDGGFSTWLENQNQKPIIVRTFVKFIWLVGKIVSKIIPIESKILSPYIVLVAQK